MKLKVQNRALRRFRAGRATRHDRRQLRKGARKQGLLKDILLFGHQSELSRPVGGKRFRRFTREEVVKMREWDRAVNELIGRMVG
jgi:hypothetical protein